MLLIDTLQSSGNTPRLHGNGFIQLDLNPLERLHIWPYPALVAQVVDTQIHNHTFGFESRILLGRTLNVVYDVFHVSRDEAATHAIYEATPRGSCPKCGPQVEHDKTPKLAAENSSFTCPVCTSEFRSEDTLLAMVPEHAFVEVRRKSVEMMEEGDRYTFPPFEYHEHAPMRNMVATIMRKTIKTPHAILPGETEATHYGRKVRPRVLCAVNRIPDNDFNRHNVEVERLWDVIAQVCLLTAGTVEG